MDLLLWLLLLAKALLGLLLAGLAGFVVLPILLAEITRWRNKQTDPLISSLFSGRVWHARFQPKYHGFNYPLFLFALDLEEVDELFSDQLWPLSLLVKFRNSDHLKNGEGKDPRKGREFEEEKCEIANRVLRLVAERTVGKFQLTLETHRVIVITHLCYYGYCFNPVSFYYLQEKASNQLASVVAEVSNTPWNEMHCYVLHSDSVDEVKVVEEKKDQSNSIHYQFPKRFHVSPFMEMDYTYDWTFQNFLQEDPLILQTNMKRGEQTAFTAKVNCTPKGLHPYTIVKQLISFPVYCFIIQLWIHYEAFWLFVKGVVFVPHPDETETAISVAIGAVMRPLFALKDWLDHLQGKSTTSGEPSSVIAPSANAKAKVN